MYASDCQLRNNDSELLIHGQLMVTLNPHLDFSALSIYWAYVLFYTQKVSWSYRPSHTAWLIDITQY